MARRSRFSEEERLDAVRRAFSEGGSPRAVASELGVSVATLYRWGNAKRPSEPQGDDAVARKLTGSAQELLRGASYPDITMEDVARRAGVPLRTAFERYPSKRVLFGAATDRAAEAIVADMSARASELQWPDDPLARLELFLVVNSEATYREPGAHVLFRDLGVPTEDRYAEQWHDAFRVALTALLREAADAGLLRPDLDVDDAGHVLARALRGLHVSVFEGAPQSVALDLIRRLPRLVSSTDR